MSAPPPDPTRLEPLVDGLAGFGPRTALRFDDDGFTFKSLVSNARFAWSDIDGSFEPRGRAVVFNLTPEALARRSAWARWNLRISRVLAGSDRQISAMIFGRSTSDLAGLLNHQRAARLRIRPRHD